ncbi:unnamed protein product [Closterium sp. Yama58-4]|nr:unnamed protein product [Closterium sp. Yama58-4]
MAGPHPRASNSPFATRQRSFLLHSTTHTRVAIVAALLVVSLFLVLPQSTRELLFHTGAPPESLSPSAFPELETTNATSGKNVHVDADVEHVTRSPLVPLTVLADLDDDGAVCLDGSPPAIHLSPGWGHGANNWLIYLEVGPTESTQVNAGQLSTRYCHMRVLWQGGGWCNSEEECAHRAATHLGSSKRMGGLMAFGGILSHDPTVNPDFYNWNLVLFRYCDGASYLGDTNEPVQTNNGLVFFRGRRIFDAVTRYLVSHHSMGAASFVLLSGCSAGGLAALQHCDRLAAILQQSVSQSGSSKGAGAEEGEGGGEKEGEGGVREGGDERVMEGRGAVGEGPVVKCISDAGFFLDSEDVGGVRRMRERFREVVQTQNVSLNERCTAAVAPHDHYLCFFPEHLLPFLRRPFFILNPLYDSWQVSFSFAQHQAFPSLDWHRCRTDLRSCPPHLLQLLHGYHHQMVSKLSPFLPGTISLHPSPQRRRRLSLVEGGGVGGGVGPMEGDGDGEDKEEGDGESGSEEETGGADSRGIEEERGSEQKGSEEERESEEKGSEEERESEEKRSEEERESEEKESEERESEENRGSEEKEENEEDKKGGGGAHVEGNKEEEEEEEEPEEKQSADEAAVKGQKEGLDVGVMGSGVEASSSQVSASASRNGALLLSCHLHCMALASQAWHGSGAPHVAGKSCDRLSTIINTRHTTYLMARLLFVVSFAVLLAVASAGQTVVTGPNNPAVNLDQAKGDNGVATVVPPGIEKAAAAGNLDKFEGTTIVSPSTDSMLMVDVKQAGWNKMKCHKDLGKPGDGACTPANCSKGGIPAKWKTSNLLKNKLGVEVYVKGNPLTLKKASPQTCCNTCAGFASCTYWQYIPDITIDGKKTDGACYLVHDNIDYSCGELTAQYATDSKPIALQSSSVLSVDCAQTEYHRAKQLSPVEEFPREPLN